MVTSLLSCFIYSCGVSSLLLFTQVLNVLEARGAGVWWPLLWCCQPALPCPSAVFNVHSLPWAHLWGQVCAEVGL